MFKTKWDEWREKQDPKLLAYLDRQPIWHDKDLYKAVAIGIVIGICIGFVWGYEVGVPDFSKMPVSFVRG